ncbi:hypothetical protein COU13_00710, partial [Candidatus Kaiserbacteria bacterium CG10_big_fil_rev_8_21_14_0_10_43_70]
MATDSLLARDRSSRLIVLIAWIIFLLIVPSFIGARISYDWFGYSTPGALLGLAMTIFIATATLPRFFVKVSALRAFVTVDLLQTFINQRSGSAGPNERVYVAYGPGLHISFPWESRDSAQNVSLEEVSEPFQVTVQLKQGPIHIKGSVRLRPDITKLVPFLGGVASIVSEVTDLIESKIIQRLGGKENIFEVLTSVRDLNDYLHEQFAVGEGGDGVAEFEERFGVNVGDVTVAEILPSEEVQKTMAGLAEAQIIAEGTAILMGYKNAEGVKRAKTRGTVTQNDINKARDRFMAASDNIKMTLDANEYTLKVEGLEKLDPETVKALGQAAALYGAA